MAIYLSLGKYKTAITTQACLTHEVLTVLAIIGALWFKGYKKLDFFQNSFILFFIIS